jgi:repressor LexA
MAKITRRQREIFNFLRDNDHNFACPPSLDELCSALGMTSRGSLYRQVMALVAAGLVEPFTGHRHGGIRLTAQAQCPDDVGEQGLPFVGKIAAGKPIEAVENVDYMTVPDMLKSDKPCYVLQVQGDSMVEAGIFHGDWVIIEQRSYADNGEIVVALIEKAEATLKYIEQTPEKVLLIPANSNMTAMTYRPEQVKIQGVLVGQMRSYRSHSAL